MTLKNALCLCVCVCVFVFFCTCVCVYVCMCVCLFMKKNVCLEFSLYLDGGIYWGKRLWRRHFETLQGFKGKKNCFFNTLTTGFGYSYEEDYIRNQVLSLLCNRKVSTRCTLFRDGCKKCKDFLNSYLETWKEVSK